MTRTIGKRVGRIDGVEKTAGRAAYAADIWLPDLLWGSALRSPLAHAKILHVDVTRARALRGVMAVLTATDLPEIRLGRQIKDLPLLARDKVRFIGEKVAVVAAEDKDVAEEALSLIEVEYEELPVITDPLMALEDDAPAIHETPAAYEGASASSRKNVVSVTERSKGDVVTALRNADLVFRHTFRTPAVHQAYIEPHACVVHIDTMNKVQVWASNKSPFLLRAQLAECIRLRPEDLVVHLVPIGGDFGGKGSLMDIPLCYYLAKFSGRPVKMVMRYEEELTAGNPRHASVVSVETAVKKTGELQGMHIKAVFDSGAYGAFKPIPEANLPGARTAGGMAYRIPAVHVESYCVYTNNEPAGHMRGPGYAQIGFAVESQMDIIARALGKDPIELRLANLVNEGDEPPLEAPWREVKAKETLSKAILASGWDTPKPGPNIGRGVAIVQKNTGVNTTGANIVVDGSGAVDVRMGIPEQGSGSHTILRQIVGEELAIAEQLITVDAGCTDTVPNSGMGSGASSVSHSMGQAVQAAAQKIRAQIIADAAAAFGVPEEKVSLRSGKFIVHRRKKIQLNFREMVGLLVRTRGSPYDVTTTYDLFPGKREFYFPGVTSFCAQVAEVEVDPETGQLFLLKITTAHDVGTILNPLTHQGQIEGALAQGIGFALMEDLHIKNGRVEAAHLGDYKIPTVRDIPPLTTALLHGSTAGPVPYKGKAIGEISSIGISAAIANAIYDAVGVRLFELPLTAERVLSELKGAKARYKAKKVEPGFSPWVAAKQPECQ
jgi:CO/xanthine dehydrogenase Mo-binding subunit